MGIQTLLIFLTILTYLAFAKSQYKVIKADVGSSSISLTLAYTGQDEYFIKPTSPIVKNLNFFFQLQTYDNFFFKITDADKKRF
jgi:hypothetical protein